MRILVYCVLMLYVLAGCNQSPRNGASSSPANDANPRVQVQQTAPQKKEIVDSNAVAQRLEQIATSIPQVEGARCVVVGNTAVVGLNLPGQMDRSKVGSMKLAVAEALKKDPYGANAIVTADMDLTARISQIRDDIQNGRTVSGFGEEMAEIIGRIMPQTPRDVPVPPSGVQPQIPNANL
jgi:YhcN/YlaJ family sporulation lipoprotein